MRISISGLHDVNFGLVFEKSEITVGDITLSIRSGGGSEFVFEMPLAKSEKLLNQLAGIIAYAKAENSLIQTVCIRKAKEDVK